MDNPKNIQISSTPNKGQIGHKTTGIIVIIVLLAVLVFVFASYEGYIPFLKLSTSANPYYSVANVQQLSSAVSRLQNSSGPFNISYSLLLSLSATSGTSVFSFNLPINGYIAHYKPYIKQTADINLGALVKDIDSLSKSINLSSFPKFLDTVNLTLLSNISYGTLCIPFSMSASAENTSLTVMGYAMNDSKVGNNSLLCVSLKTNNLANSTALSSILSTSMASANISNISQFSDYLQVKYMKSESYNGNSCSLLDINTTPAFESKYNSSMHFNFCFSNTYGIPLNGSFVLNLTRDSSAIMSLFNSYGNAGSVPNFSNIVLSASFKSAFNRAPSSVSILSSLPPGSYTLNENSLLQTIGELNIMPAAPTNVTKAPAANADLTALVSDSFPGLNQIYLSPTAAADEGINPGVFENYYLFGAGNAVLAMENGSSTNGINGTTILFGVSNTTENLSYYYHIFLGIPGISISNITLDAIPAIKIVTNLSSYEVITVLGVTNSSLYEMSAVSTGEVYINEVNSGMANFIKNFKLDYLN